MIPTTCYFTKRQLRLMRELKESDGQPIADTIRRAVDLYFSTKRGIFNKQITDRLAKRALTAEESRE